ncbi:hypothetical protein [Corallococcus exercitus]|uniref:Uncharacterized protein n=1 Tax=Corallococcus exercitus TaxID=2316736 RepID=A0A7Y4NCK7_9BACT|nr:hypothetical protein [Corallococcus exercitus]NOK08964.1 hypothetical protein [Corallococcus exercitus]
MLIFMRRFNPFIQKIDLNFPVDRGGRLDRPLGIAAAVFLGAIDCRQSGN